MRGPAASDRARSAGRESPSLRASVRLFAVARERAGRPVVEVELPEPATVADLRVALGRDVPPLAPILASLRFAVDAAYADDATPIGPGSELAAIPPVSGGAPRGTRS